MFLLFSTLYMHSQSTSHTGIIFIAFAKIMLIDPLFFSCTLKLHFLRGIEGDQYFPWLVTPKREHFGEIEVISNKKLKNGNPYPSCPLLAENKRVCELQS